MSWNNSFSTVRNSRPPSGTRANPFKPGYEKNCTTLTPDVCPIPKLRYYNRNI